MDSIMFLYAFKGSSDEASKIIITIILQVDGTTSSRIGSPTILGEIYRGRVAESQEIRHLSLFRHLEKTSLSLLLVPVVSAISLQKALSTSATLYLRRITLFLTARPQVESPDRQADTFRLPLRIVFHGKEPVCNFLLLLLRPKSQELHAPRITRSKMLDMLFRGVGEDFVSDDWFLGCHQAKAR